MLTSATVYRGEDPNTPVLMAVYRLADRLWYDFADGTFKALDAAKAGKLLGPMAQLPAPLDKSYLQVIDDTSKWPDGAYLTFFVEGANGDGGAFDILGTNIHDGDEAPVFHLFPPAAGPFKGSFTIDGPSPAGG